jgi:hypothetical protein
MQSHRKHVKRGIHLLTGKENVRVTSHDGSRLVVRGQYQGSQRPRSMAGWYRVGEVGLTRRLKTHPKEEMFHFVSQMCRCALVVLSNIAEGAARNGRKEFLQFLRIALDHSVGLTPGSRYQERPESVTRLD